MSADDCFNYYVSIILVLLHIRRKLSYSCFFYFISFFFQKILVVVTIVNIIIKVII